MDSTPVTCPMCGGLVGAGLWKCPACGEAMAGATPAPSKYFVFLLYPISAVMLLATVGGLVLLSFAPVLIVVSVMFSAAVAGAYAIREFVRYVNGRDDRHGAP